jgi:ATP-grasp domain
MVPFVAAGSLAKVQTFFSQAPMSGSVLLLFDYDWDSVGFAQAAQGMRIERAGFDLFSFPDNAKLAFFDIERFTSRLARRAPKDLRAVVSAHEQFGALAAAMLAEKLGLPGTKPEAILRCQHKLALRELIERVAPEANPRFSQLPMNYGDPIPSGLEWPLFVKPIKAAYSVLARVCHSPEELAALLKFSWPERWIIEHLVEPFERVARARMPDLQVSAHRMLMEEPIDCPQFNLDGYVFNGQCRRLGIVDELMYPGTQAFLRFAYPSRLPEAIQTRAFDLADKILAAAQFTHGFFNMEFFYDQATDRLTVIEINPRLGSQLADLYHRTQGIDVYRMVLAMGMGKDPALVPLEPSACTAAASFVFRTFGDQAIPAAPTESQLAWLKAFDPQALFMNFAKDAIGIKREMKWLGSHRYATLNMAARDEATLHEKYRAVCQHFGWPAAL